MMRLSRHGANLLKPVHEAGPLALLINQFRSPLFLLLLAAMVLSFLLGDRMDALIVFSVVLMSTLLGFAQEYRAANAVAALLSTIMIKATVLRDGINMELPISEIVPGDVVLLSAGDTVPGDGLLLASKDLFVDESTLTGESYLLANEAVKQMLFRQLETKEISSVQS